MIVCAVSSAIFSGTWDILMDWSLFEDWKFRKTRIYPNWYSTYLTSRVYIPAIILNILLRFSWVLLISPDQWLETDQFQGLIFGLAVLEMIRRFIWALFRVENEMVNNIGQFRVVREIPLPLEEDE
jgi:hypothetical protein